MTPIIRLNNITKTFAIARRKHLAVLKDISLDVHDGEFLAIIGPSGAGKSTLLRIISGLETEFTGSVTYAEGVKRDHISFVFQQFALLPWLTIQENVGLPLLREKLTVHERTQQITAELQRFGLEKFAHAFPRELSGGMRQRAGIARALVTKPKIILMDEPFSELDFFTAEELRHEVLQIWQEQKLTIILVTHLIDEALKMADRVVALSQRPATIERIMTNPLPRPRDVRSTDFYHHYDTLAEVLKPQ